MMQKKSRGMLAGALCSMFMLSMMYKFGKGTVVAQLPFEPIVPFSKLTHSGLEGDNFRECSISFIYVLSNLTIGNYIKKLMALEGERVAMPMPGGSPWG